MPRIIDLDLIAPPGVIVRKSGHDYKLPGDPPVDVWLGVIDAHDQFVSSDNGGHVDAQRVFHDRMLDLFRLENPGLATLPFGLAGMFSVLAGFYGADMDEPDPDPPGADEAASTTKTTNGRASSPAKKKARTTTPSRSSR